MIIFVLCLYNSNMKKFISLSVSVLTVFMVSCCRSELPKPKLPAIPADNPQTGKEDTTDPWTDPEAPANPEYLCNGKIQIGVDMDRGAGVFHFSEAGTKKNLLNRFDEGRFIQQSYYGYDDGSRWNGQAWVWNPVQGGCWDSSVKGKVTESRKEGNTLYVKTIPALWATCKLAEDCVFEENISLNGKVAKILFSMSYTGSKTGGKRHQELPAVFVDWNLSTFVCYNGTKPWTNDPALTSYVPRNLEESGNSYQDYTEGWAAFIGPDGKGIGLYSPSTTQCTLYRYGYGPGGSKAASCSYFAPIKAMAITPGFKFNYKVFITYGTVDEIRAVFKSIHDAGDR